MTQNRPVARSRVGRSRSRTTTEGRVRLLRRAYAGAVAGRGTGAGERARRRSRPVGASHQAPGASRHSPGSRGPPPGASVPGRAPPAFASAGCQLAGAVRGRRRGGGALPRARSGPAVAPVPRLVPSGRRWGRARRVPHRPSRRLMRPVRGCLCVRCSRSRPTVAQDPRGCAGGVLPAAAAVTGGTGACLRGAPRRQWSVPRRGARTVAPCCRTALPRPASRLEQRSPYGACPVRDHDLRCDAPSTNRKRMVV
jgi:hypothetical protein